MWGCTNTNLYRDHAKSENICLRCCFIASLENLWRGPCRSVSPYWRHKNRIQPANKRSKSEIRQTGMTVVVDDNVGLAKCCQYGLKRHREVTCPFQVTVYCTVCVKVVETLRHIQQLGGITSSVRQ